MNPDGCGSSGGSEVVRFRNSGAAGVPVHDGAGVTPHRWLKATFAKLNLVKATFSHYRTAPKDTRVTPVTGRSSPNLAVPSEGPHPSAIMIHPSRATPDLTPQLQAHDTRSTFRDDPPDTRQCGTSTSTSVGTGWSVRSASNSLVFFTGSQLTTSPTLVCEPLDRKSTRLN